MSKYIWVDFDKHTVEIIDFDKMAKEQGWVLPWRKEAKR